jgi:hypothetical protein
MVREINIEPPGSPLLWIPNVFRFQSALPRIDSALSMLIPVVDAFGTEKLASGEVGFAEVLGALGAVEVSHNAPLADGVNTPRARQYLSMEYWHDDIVNHQLRAGRILPESSGLFPFVALRDSVDIPGDTGAGGGDNRLAVRNFHIGPNMRAAVRADAMGGGARITLRVTFVEFILGQYTHIL